MFRRDVLKGVFGGAAAVALGEMGFGTQAAEAQDLCTSVASKCADGCHGDCLFSCQFPQYASCPACQECREAARCAPATSYCAKGCSRTCANRCRGASVGCAACEVCDPA